MQTHVAKKTVKATCRAAGLAALVCLGLYSGPGAALVVYIPTLATSYDMASLPAASFTANQALIQSQVWWGSQALAAEFASAVQSGLGTPNGGTMGPFFAFSVSAPFVTSMGWDGTVPTLRNMHQDSAVFSYAVAVPAPLPILGVVAAFGWSRQLRRRIKAARAATA